jgi:hypothetical protein
MSRLFNALIWTVLLLAFMGMVTSIYWLTYPYKTVYFKNVPFPVQNKVVTSGDTLFYTVAYCKYTKQLPEVIKYFIDGIVYETPRGIGIINEGCGTVVSSVYIPYTMPKGNFTLKIVAKYKVNPLRNIETVSYTESFAIK